MLLYVIGLLKYGIGQLNEDVSQETYKISIKVGIFSHSNT
jgi:hypothetical protein